MGEITRRNFINGTLVAAGSSMLAREVQTQQRAAERGLYPPELTGLRGSHPGANTHAHDKAWGRRSDFGTPTDLEEAYELVVVGGGLSGLAAAHFFREKHRDDAKILVLDNHDDFGGHAKRNEHTVGGKLLIGYGGSQTLVEPGEAGSVVRRLLRDVGVDLKRFETAYDSAFFRRHGLSAVTYFNKDTFGADQVVQHPLCNYPNFIDGLPQALLSNEEAARQAPLSEAGKDQLLRALNGGLHVLNLSGAKLRDYVRTNSYWSYLSDTLGIDDPGVLDIARCSALDWGSTGADIMTIAEAKSSGALGFEPVAVYDADHPYIHHFPDGNAGLARAMVKKLVPQVAEGSNAEELVLARFDYSKLDQPSNGARIRLSSTVVDVQHAGEATSASDVLVSYVHEGRLYRVKSRGVVMACYNMMIPHIVPDLPEDQAEALRQQQKMPLQYTTVGLRNWRAVREIGMGMAMCPGNMHQGVFMDFPVSLGGYEFTKSPDDPCVLQLIHCPYGKVGEPAAKQYRDARYRMLRLKFEDYEEEIRRHLTGMLPSSSFNFDRDVESLTVNRWAHGYTVAGPGDTVQRGRRSFGRITIANSDSAPSADAKAAIRMGWRAVNELG